jgi:hypothetical protein
MRFVKSVIGVARRHIFKNESMRRQPVEDNRFMKFGGTVRSGRNMPANSPRGRRILGRPSYGMVEGPIIFFASKLGI